MPLAPAYVEIEKISSLQNILDELTRLKRTLNESELRQFIVFNDAYFVVTSNINQAVGSGQFENPKFVEKFSVSFVHYYFRAINSTMRNADLPNAWYSLNKTSKRKTTPNFILLLMGANAHINHDFALTLAELVDQEETDNFLEDVIKMDKLLMKSGREIINTFNEPSSLLNFLKRRFVFVYYRPVMYMVRFWRIRSWARYKSIKRNGLRDSAYANGSIKIARRFFLLARLIG